VTAKVQAINPIRLSLPYHLGSVNCYLIDTSAGYVLIDTGLSKNRAALETALASAGCHPGLLRLIILTHGDFDHTGNAAYLRERYRTKLAMNIDDWGMIERGDMFCNRRKGNKMIGMIARRLFSFGTSARCRPDLSLADGDDLASHGFEAIVLSLPGHSGGSIGILTHDGDVFCGDLLENMKRPALNRLNDDQAAACASLERLQGLGTRTIYPGHGDPFQLEQVTRTG
jgi:glyoxylase-like metal-dependent hydrolase (beta-lactamase superfamily II)